MDVVDIQIWYSLFRDSYSIYAKCVVLISLVIDVVVVPLVKKFSVMYERLDLKEIIALFQRLER